MSLEIHLIGEVHTDLSLYTRKAMALLKFQPDIVLLEERLDQEKEEDRFSADQIESICSYFTYIETLIRTSTSSGDLDNLTKEDLLQYLKSTSALIKSSPDLIRYIAATYYENQKEVDILSIYDPHMETHVNQARNQWFSKYSSEEVPYAFTNLFKYGINGLVLFDKIDVSQLSVDEVLFSIQKYNQNIQKTYMDLRTYDTLSSDEISLLIDNQNQHFAAEIDKQVVVYQRSKQSKRVVVFLGAGHLEDINGHNSVYAILNNKYKRFHDISLQKHLLCNF